VNPRYLCQDCHFLGAPAKTLRGSPALELVLWLCFVLPGAAYAWWRSRGVILLCGRCGSVRVLPEFSGEASSAIGTRAELPDQTLGKAVVFWRTLWAVPLISGVGIVVVFLLSAVAPTVRNQVWFEWLFYVVAAPIVGHGLWSTVHLVAWVMDRFRAKG